MLLGIAGGRHEGPNLTDTILFVSLNPSENKATLISIPRDLWTKDLNAKINTAYAIGEERKKGGGLILTNAIVSKILNQPIHYALRVDFEGFTKAIDLLEGIDVNLIQGFDDFQYPIDGKENDTCGYEEEEIKSRLATASSQLEVFPCRYRRIHFAQGIQNLNGDQALEIVRSRHAQGQEGTDFARSKRQEAVLEGIKDKALSLQLLLSPGKIIGLNTLLKESIDTNIKEEEIDDFIRLLQKMKDATIHSSFLDYGDKDRAGLLVNSTISKD